MNPLEVMKQSDKILELIDNADGMTRGDLQGATEAIVMDIMRASSNDQVA